MSAASLCGHKGPACKEYLDNTVITEYVHEISDRFNAGEIGQDHANAMRCEIEQFVHFVKNSEVEIPNPLLGTRMVLPLEFQSIADSFLASDKARFGASGKPVALNTFNDMRWMAHKYFE